MSLTGKQIDATLLVAQDRLTNKRIAEELEISERTLDAWKKDLEFKRAVEEILNAWMIEVHKKGIADRRRRLFQQNQRWRKLQAIAEARAKDPSIRRLPGGNTGFMVRTLKSIRKGDGAWAVIEEATFDSALCRDLLAHEERAARELGQWDADKPERKITRLSDLTREEMDAVMLDIHKTHGIPMPETPPDSGTTA